MSGVDDGRIIRLMEAELAKKSNPQKTNAGWALFLDFDGTLVDIAPSPESVEVPEDLPALLARLDNVLSGAVAIVTGRSIDAIDLYLAPWRPVTAGAHGAEIRMGREKIVQAAKSLPPEWVAAVSALCGKVQGASIEIKRSSISVHYRSNPGAGPRIEDELRQALRGELGDFVILPGRMVFEIMPSHVSKGRAVETLLELPQFSGRRPLMIGDDRSDEAAFRAAEQRGGLALTVAGEHFPKESADFSRPSEVRDWLAAFAASLGE